MTGSPQILRPATAEEMAYIRTLNAVSWAGDLDVKTYHDRERVLSSTALTRDGGISCWVLVNPAEPHEVLSSCETIKKHALVSLPPPSPAGVGPGDAACLVSPVTAHVVGNVFTPPKHRRNGYANTMLRLLAEALKHGSPESFSALYSDIGKKFYSELGWLPHRSCQVDIPAVAAATAGAVVGVKSLGAADVPSLCAEDIMVLKNSLVRPRPDLKPHVAFVPDYQTMEWHWAREEFMAPMLRRQLAAAGVKPDAKGAMTPDGKRWVIWNRDLSHRSQLFIIRAVNLSCSSDEDAEVAHLAQLLLAACAEAASWGLAKVVLWNPDDLWLRAARRAAPPTPAAAIRLVDRDTDSICSLMMHGPLAAGSSPDHVDWLANEKFAWC